MKKLLIPVVVALFPLLAYADGGCVNDIAIKRSSAFLAPVPNASVRVCTDAQCNSLATLYTDATLQVSTANPVIADGNGNYSFCTATGTYTVKVTDPQSSQVVTQRNVSVVLNGSSVALKKINGIRFADSPEFTAGSTTGGINEAIADFGVAPACGKLILPRGTVTVTATVDISNREGCVIEGHGNGESSTVASTRIVWGGAANGTVFKVHSTRWSTFRDFMIDGANGAGIGLEYTALNATAASQQNKFSNVTIRNVGGTPGYSLHVGTATNQQVSETEFDLINIFVPQDKIGVFQEGTQTLNVVYRRSQISGAYQYAMDIADGDINTENLLTLRQAGGTTLADIRVQPAANTANFTNNYHEANYVSTAPVYSFPSSNARNFPTIFTGGGLLWENTSGTMFDYQQTSPLTINGFRFSKSSAGVGTINISPAGGGTNPLVLWSPGLVDSAFTVTIGSNAAVMRFRNTPGEATPLNSAAPLVTNNLGWVMNGGSLTFRDADATPRFKLYTSSSELIFTDAANAVMFKVNAAGVVRPGTSGMDFGSTAAQWSLFGDLLNINNGTATINSSGNASLVNLTVTAGVPQGGGIKHQRFATTTATAASSGAVITEVLTWTAPFADANYTVTCLGDLVTSGVPLVGGITAKAAASVTFQTVAATAVAARFTTIDCVAMHD